MTIAEFLAELAPLIGPRADGAKLKIEHRSTGALDAFIWPDTRDPRRTWWGVTAGTGVFAFGWSLDDRLERDLAAGIRIAAANHRAAKRVVEMGLR